MQMKHQKKNGFGLLELVVVIAIVSVISMVAVPSMSKYIKRREKLTFFSSLDSLVQVACQQSIYNGEPIRLYFGFKNKIITIEKAEKNDTTGQVIYKEIKTGVLTSYVWPESIKFEQFIVQGVDEIARHGSDRDLDNVWFFVSPDGITQEVVINGHDKNEVDIENNFKKFGLVLNPFNGRFSVYEEFQSASPV